MMKPMSYSFRNPLIAGSAPAQMDGIDTSAPGYQAAQVASMAAVAALVYHGYKRNHSVGWALAWGLLGGVVWPIALPIAVAQGFGKRHR